MRRVLTDTSAYFPFADRQDVNHTAAQNLLAQLASEGTRLFTTNFIMAEAHPLLLTRISHRTATDFLKSFDQGGTTLVRATAADEQQGRAIILPVR